MKFKPAYLILILAAAGCRGRSGGAAPLVQTTETVAYDAIPSVTYPAKAYAGDKSNVSFRVSGTISGICVKPGDMVNKGDVIALLDDRDYEMQLKATTAEYEQVKAEVERVEAMYVESAVSENDYDKARYGLKQMEQKYEHHKAQYEDCSLKAPISGYIGDVFFSSGETVVAGLPVISIALSGHVCLHVNLSAQDFLRSGQFGEITAEFSALPGKRFGLSVESLSKVANTNQMYEMRLSISGDALDCITPGMTAMVTINFDSKAEGCVVVPARAVFGGGDGNSKVLLYDGQAEAVNVVPVEVVELLKDGNAVVKGLEPGIEIVSAGVGKLQDGQKVRKAVKPGVNNPGGLL